MVNDKVMSMISYIKINN